MAVGTIKRLLALINIVAVLALAGTAWGFWQHKSALGQVPEPIDFAHEVQRGSDSLVLIDSVAMRLGRFPQAREETNVDSPTTEEKIETVLDQLGAIKSAIVVYPPYDTLPVPAITFEFKSGAEGARIKTIRLGDALRTRPHSDPNLAKHFEVPVNFMFVGCEPVPGRPNWTYFLFDMNCDGKDIQKAKWKGDIDYTPPTTAKPGETALPEHRARPGLYIGTGRPSKRKPAKPDANKPTQVEPVAPVKPPTSDSLYGPLFEEEGGTFAPTEEGVAYLRDNYQKVLKDARMVTDKDPKTKRPRGILIKSIRSDSVADKFGIRRDDVILSINDRAVTKQAQAVNVVKDELRRMRGTTRHKIQVKILRNGRTEVLQFDTRDPDTRRRAKDAFGRGRRR